MTAPKQIGKYEILERIGKGATAVVFKARHIESGIIVALKQLVDFPGSEAEFYQRFIDEGRTAASLDHPNIVQVYEFGEMEGKFCIAMELVGEGYSLREYLKDHETLDLAAAISILRQLAEALTYLHQQDLTHRDVKPANILLEKSSGSIKVALADFGLVRSTAHMSLTIGTSSMSGTPPYMAPEQAESPRWGNISSLTDVYALGIVAYEMLVGCPPFEGAPAKVLHLQAYENPPSPLKFAPNLGSDLSAVLLKVLSKAPQKRYQSTTDFVEALCEIEETRKCCEIGEQKIVEIIKRARAARKNEDWLIVQECCVQAMHIDPANREVSKMMDEATPQLRRLNEEKATQKRLAQLYEEGEKALAVSEWTAAITPFQKIRSVDPDYREVRRLLAEALTKSGMLSENGFQGSSIVQRGEIHSILERAEKQVRILGVVALNADWSRLVTSWHSKLPLAPNLTIQILCESDDMLFSKSFTHDTEMAKNRLSYRTLKFRRDRALVNLPGFFKSPSAGSQFLADSVEIGITYLHVPISIVNGSDSFHLT